MPGRSVPWLLAGLFTLLYAALAVRDQQQMSTTGYDLGIFDQAVRSYAHGQLPIVPLKGPGFDLLGDHFSPIIATLAPFYRLWPSPYVLLLAQAALFGVSIAPLTRWAARVLGTGPAAVVGACYGLSWGLASAAGFDFHEVAFAVPLLAFSVTALGERRLRAAVLWALPLLLVKEDLGLTVTVVGLLVAARGDRRLGLATAVAGVAGTVLEIVVIIPAINPRGYLYFSFVPGAARATTGLAGVGLGHGALGDHLGMKLMTLVLLFAPTAFLALRSSLAWLVVPTLTWRFLADNPAYWGTGFQYSAVLMPMVAAAWVEALAARAGEEKRSGRRGWGAVRVGDGLGTAVGGGAGARGAVWARLGARRLTGVWLFVIAGAVVTALLVPGYPLARLAKGATWSTPARLSVAHRMLGLIPDGAQVVATDALVPQLTERTTVTLFGEQPGPSPAVDWVIVDTDAAVKFPLNAAQTSVLIKEDEGVGHRLVAADDGYVVLGPAPDGSGAG